MQRDEADWRLPFTMKVQSRVAPPPVVHTVWTAEWRRLDEQLSGGLKMKRSSIRVKWSMS